MESWRAMVESYSIIKPKMVIKGISGLHDIRKVNGA